jgi:hypothetical protein
MFFHAKEQKLELKMAKSSGSKTYFRMERPETFLETSSKEEFRHLKS